MRPARSSARQLAVEQAIRSPHPAVNSNPVIPLNASARIWKYHPYPSPTALPANLATSSRWESVISG
jgi:hypothetical protein